jgi:hypothetical protein
MKSKELLKLKFSELGELYRNGKVPEKENLPGDYSGTVLEASDEFSLIFFPVKGFLNSPLFPWKGKSFYLEGEEIKGDNRLFSDILPLRLFPFKATMERSLFGDFEALVLDYNLFPNPPLIRRIRDELREIEENLLLGQVYFKTIFGPRLIMYFSLEK